jgi:hypothetical protein
MGRSPHQASQQQSRVSTGKRSSPFALIANGRSAWAVRFRTLIAQRVADLGGLDALSAAQHSLVRRSAMLELSLEKMESDAANGADIDFDVYTRASGTLLRLLKTLGLKKHTSIKPAPSLANWQRSERPWSAE